MSNNIERKNNANDTAVYQNKVSAVLKSGAEKPSVIVNPFLDKKGNLANPYINYQKALDSPNTSDRAKQFIQQATGLSPKQVEYKSTSGAVGTDFNSNINEDNLTALDITTGLPKLNTGQISEIISKHFSNSPVIKPSDAEGIYKAQQQSGMSALAILGIGALESGYGTSNIAKEKNNIWGWNATNVNPGGNAAVFSQMSQGASEFANNFIKTYYNGYGAKTIQSAGTGNNPARKGYAYNDNGTINSKWATDVGSIMKTFYNTAKGVNSANGYSGFGTPSQSNKIVSSAKNYLGMPYVWGGESVSEGGMDCSGFVYNALKDAGYKVDRTTAQGYRSYGKVVSKSDMQPGDLIFFGKNNDASHIGIYLGNGQMIHSSGGSKNTKSNPGKGVSITNVDYRNDFLEARRY